MENILNWTFPFAFYLLNRMGNHSFCRKLFVVAGASLNVVLVPPRSIAAVIALGEAAGRWLVISIVKLLYAFIGITIICFVICGLSRVVFHPIL